LFVLRETDDEALLLQLGAFQAEIEIVFAGGGEEGIGGGGISKREHGGADDERIVEGGAAELVEFEERGVEGEFGVGGAALEGKFGGLDHTRFEERSEAGRFAGEERVLERGETVGDRAHGGGAGVGRVQAVGEGAGARFEGVAETGEAEFGEGDLAVGEGFAEGEAAGPFEGLRE